MYYRYATLSRVKLTKEASQEMLRVEVFDRPKSDELFQPALSPILVLLYYPDANRSCLPRVTIDYYYYESFHIMHDELHRMMHFVAVPAWRDKVDRYDSIVTYL